MAETDYTPFESKPDAATVRLIVRRVKPTPGSQLALFTNYSYHAFITDRDGDTLDLEADHRRHRDRGEQVRRGAQPPPLGTLPRQPGWPQVMAHNLARWTTRMGEQLATTKLRRRPDGSLARPAVSPCTCRKKALARLAPCHSPPDGTHGLFDRLADDPTVSDDLARRRRCGPSTSPWRATTPWPSWIGAQGHAVSSRLLSSLASSGWPDPFGGPRCPKPRC